MNRTLIVCASLGAALGTLGCGSGADKPLTIPTTAYLKAPLPNVEPVRGPDHERQALDGAIARWAQWANRHYGRASLDKAATSCVQQVEDLWNCTVTVNVTEPVAGWHAGPVAGGYQVTRDTRRNQMIYIEAGAR